MGYLVLGFRGSGVSIGYQWGIIGYLVLVLLGVASLVVHRQDHLLQLLLRTADQLRGRLPLPGTHRTRC